MNDVENVLNSILLKLESGEPMSDEEIEVAMTHALIGEEEDE